MAVIVVATGLLSGCGGSDAGGAAPSTAPSPLAGPTPSPAPSTTPSPTPPPQPTASDCTVSVTGIPTSVSAPNGRYPFSITTGSNCAWTARADVQWADVSPGSGQGNATPQLNVSEYHERDPRTINVEVNGKSYRVIQQPPSCTYGVQPRTLDLGGGGGGVFVELTATDRCAWSASASESWIRVPVPNGAGSASVELVLDPNPNFSPRTGYVTLAGLRIDVTQQRKP